MLHILTSLHNIIRHPPHLLKAKIPLNITIGTRNNHVTIAAPGVHVDGRVEGWFGPFVHFEEEGPFPFGDEFEFVQGWFAAGDCGRVAAGD